MEEHNLLPRKNQLEGKYIKSEIFSENNPEAGTSIDYEIDKKLDINGEIIQGNEIHQSREHNLRPEKNELDEEIQITQISSTNDSAAKTLIKYEVDETLDIKGEIDQGIPSADYSSAKPLMRYETLYIKEETIQNQENTDEQSNENCESKSCIVSRGGAHNLIDVAEPGEHIEQKIQKLGRQADKKGSFSKCINLRYLLSSKSRHLKRHHYNKCSCPISRSDILNDHICSEQAAVEPQFICDFCGYKTKRKYHLSEHIIARHLQAPETRHYCDKCACSYSRLSTLYAHKRVKHGAVKPQFTCDLCRYETKRKGDLTKHMISRHIPKTKIEHLTRHYCDQCSCSYTHSRHLNAHKRVEHEAVRPQFMCDICGYKANWKSNLSQHIISQHLQRTKTRHCCDKCPQSYSWLSDLNRHKRLKHAEVKLQYTCDICGHKTNSKRNLSLHFSSRHSTKHYCDKCSSSYSQLYTLDTHKRLKHPIVKP